MSDGFRPGEALEHLFVSRVSTSAREAMRQAVLDAYREANSEMHRGHFPDSVVKDFLPIARRAMLERNLLQQMAEYDEAVIEHRTNVRKSANHFLLRVGPFLLTESLVDGPRCMARDADFRKGYATAYQLAFFETVDESQLSLVEGEQYGIIIHGPRLDDRSRPQFVHVVFPNDDHTGYIGRVVLFEGEGVTSTTVPDVPTETIGDEAMPRLRPSAWAQEQAE